MGSAAGGGAGAGPALGRGGRRERGPQCCRGVRRAVVASAAMGQIEWAMWANEQALASGLSECAPGPRAAGRPRGGSESGD